MRRNRASEGEPASENGGVLVSDTPSVNSAEIRARKRRRTILESLQSLTLKPPNDNDDDETTTDEGKSSCATGGSLNMRDDDEDDDSLSDHCGMDLLSDQEKVHREVMYQLVTGKKKPEQRRDVVSDRIEQMIRQSRFKAASSQDDFHIQLGRDHEVMDVDNPSPLKRSASLPPDYMEGSCDPPMETIEVFEMN